jgi:putative FmdB family regulatory protein
MPMYEYQCGSCNVVFERQRTMSKMLEPETEPCPECSAETVKKVILTAPGLADPMRLGLRKPDSGFREVLHKIHEKTPGSRLNQTATHF